MAADNPTADKTMIYMHAVMSEWERDQISKRTKDALAAAKARGVKLGTTGPANLKRNIVQRQKAADAFAAKLAGMIAGFRARGLSQRAMVNELSTIGIRTPKGGEWRLGQLCRLLKRIAAPMTRAPAGTAAPPPRVANPGAAPGKRSLQTRLPAPLIIK
ncbi:recombinase family protein [Paraburkholderia atlantica]|uniref:recombinase family protein n=1 Tax=Paraburkholderia atlantica TaxID=2654982 RepID=UPI000A0601AF|nr:recombinase family protein [Paraburkholderia atlantica]